MTAALAHIEQSPEFQLGGPGLFILSTLSDVQELLEASGLAADAARLINEVKRLIVHYQLGIDQPVGALLATHIAHKYRTQASAAKAWGVSPAFVSMVIRGTKLPTAAILADAGLRRVVQYRRVAP